MPSSEFLSPDWLAKLKSAERAGLCVRGWGVMGGIQAGGCWVDGEHCVYDCRCGCGQGGS